MRVGAGSPRYLYLEERPAGEQNFTTLRVYVRNVTVECEGIVETCGGYTVEEVRILAWQLWQTCIAHLPA